jgi:hypothetical protein
MARRISWRPPCRRPRRRAGSIRLADGRIFDLDIHRIPASHHGLKHEHIDVRFLVEIDDWLPAPGNDESHQVRWMPLNQVLRFNNNRSTFRMPEMPEALDYTSFQARIRAYAEQRQPPSEREGSALLAGEACLCPAVSPKAGSQPPRNGLSEPSAALLPFRGGERLNSPVAGIPFTFADWTSRAIREDKRGFIPTEVPPILKRLGIEENGWVETVRDYGRHFGRFVGPAERLRQLAGRWDHRWLWGLKPSGILYPRLSECD